MISHGVRDLVSLFGQAAQSTPDSIAVDHEDGTLTYAELERAADSLCLELLSRGVHSGSPVILVTAHGTRNIVAVLAILKAGGCYVPIDRDTWATQRIEHVIKTVTDAVLVVNTTPTAFYSDAHEVLHLQHAFYPGTKKQLDVSASNSDPSIGPPSPACIIFTSGSTGRPKGVMLAHQGIANYAQTSPFNMDVRQGDRVLHILSVAFDASTGMLFSILGNSGTVVPATMNDLYQKAVTCSITASTPSILASLPAPSAQHNPYPHVHTALLGGETPPLDLLKAWTGAGVRILNAYGPTESTTASTMQTVEVDSSGGIRSSIIGKAMPQCPVHLLDEEDSEIMNDGLDGELVVSGCSLALGYYNDPEKTASAFKTWSGKRIYRTGDVARWSRSNDGSRVLEFRGRRDRTVKNRGFLINLDWDVEAAIQKSQPKVEGIYASMFRGKLVALVVPETLDTELLQDDLRKELSTFHIPDQIIAMKALPLSANGKIDPKGVFQLLERMNESAGQDEIPSDADISPKEVIGRCMAKALGIPRSKLGEDADFVSCGGNSLTALKFVSLCYAYNLHLSPRDVYTERTWRKLSEFVADQELSQPSSPNQPQRDSVERAPLTDQQLELCIPTMECPGKNCNQVFKRYELTYAKAIKTAWRRVWESEPLFRTEIALDEELGSQILRPKAEFAPIEVTTSDRNEYLSLTRNVSLDVGLGMRLDIISYVPTDGSCGDGEATVVWTVHHALVDGFSLALVLSKVEQAAKDGSILSPSPPFANAAASLTALQSQKDHEARGFWTHYLDGVPETPQWLSKRSGTTQRPEKALELRFDLKQQADALQSLAAGYGSTVATVYYTAWAIALSARTGSRDVVVGAVHSGRQSLLEHVDAIGQLMTTLPLVVHLNPENTISKQLAEIMLDISRCAEYSWSSSRHLNYQVSNLLATQYDFPEYEEVIPARETCFFENSDFPLSLLVEEDAQFRLLFDSSCYSQQAMESLSADFRMALLHLLNGEFMGDCLFQNNQKLTSTPSKDVLVASDTPSYARSTLVAAFESSAIWHSDLPAVEGPDACYTYKQLDSLSNAVAHEIIRLCPGAHTVAIYADGSAKWVVGIVGILKAGCAYCPIDPAYPIERRTAVFKRSGSSAVVIPDTCQVNEAEGFSQGAVTIKVSDFASDPDTCLSPPGIYVDPASDALVVFTSGTTGTPKGVPISHQGLLALQSNPEATMFSRPALRIAQYMSPAFDYCSNEIFSALLHGGTLVLRVPGDPNEHLKKVDAATITPSALGVLDPNDFPNLRIVYATGEPVSPALVNLWAPGRIFYNAYGPAECSICTSFTRLVPGQQVTIGKAIKTARMYVLNSDRHQAGVGEQGEIYLAGIQVLRGYIGADEEAGRKIQPDPWHPGQKMYRTGDYGRYTDSGDIFYIGRMDRQVKVRGYRVELAAVEQKIYELEPRVTLAAVLTVNDNLVAYVKPETIDTECLRQSLAKSLQPSWVPHFIVALESFPMTPNVKIDFRELAKTKLIAPQEESKEAVALHGEVEETIAVVWRHVLKLPDDLTLSACQSFMNLGGNSVLQMLLAVRLSKTFGVQLSVRQIIATPVLRDQAALVHQQKTQSNKPVSAPCAELTVRDLTHLEKQAWFQYQIGTSKTTFNIPVLLHLNGEFDSQRLVDALNAAMATRSLLRSNIIATNNGPVRVLRSTSPQVRRVEKLDVSKELATDFDPSKDELIRVFLSQDNQLLVIMSHAIADLNGVQVLLRQASRAYHGECIGGPRFQYLTSAAWSQKSGKEEQDYWRKTLRNIPACTGLDLIPSRTLFEGSSTTEIYQGARITKLLDVMQRASVSRHQVACTAVAQTMQWLSKRDDVVLGSPYENRHSEQDRDSVGLFLDRVPLRIKSPNDASCVDLLRHTRDVAQGALANAIPFHELMAALNMPPTMDRHPIFQTMVTFHLRGVTESCLSIPGCEVERVQCHPPGSKFLLMFEWTELEDDKWMMRIEYDHTRIQKKTINAIQQALDMVLDCMACELSRKEIHEILTSRLPDPRQKQPIEQDRIIYTIRQQMAACLNMDMKKLPCTLNYFDAGATSMDVFRLQRRLKRVGLDCSICTIFDLPTAESLSRHFVC